MNSQRPGTGRRGFTLVELLTVIAVVTILSTLAVPALVSVGAAGTFRSNVSQMKDLLEQAYSAALARNTYVWVGVMQMPNNGGVGLTFVYSQSENPTDLIKDASGNTHFSPLAKPVILPNLILTTITTQVTDSNRATQSVVQLYPGATGTPNLLVVPDANNQLQPASFVTQLGGSSQQIMTNGATPFTTVLEVTPSGQVNVSSSKYAWIEIGLAPLKGNAKDVAVLQMNAFTGRVVEFVP